MSQPGPDPTAPFDAVLRRRRMVRTFTDEPVGDGLVDRLLESACRAPSAGNTRPWSFLVLRDEQVRRYWNVTMPDASVRGAFRWRSLLEAPVLVVPYVRPMAYVERYQEDDKANTPLGLGLAAWSVPYWWIDGGAVVQNLLLAATAAGLGACFFGQFEHEAAVRDTFGVPPDQRALGTIAIGHPGTDAPGRSQERKRPRLGEIVHHGTW